MNTISLAEWEPRRGVELTPVQVTALAASRYVTITPDPQPSGTWQVTAQSHVGVLALAGLEIRIRPKIGISRLLALLSRHIVKVSFDADRVDWGTDDDLTAMIANAFITETEKLLAGGLLSGYRAVDESLLTIRGRIDMGRHVAARAGMPLPVEVTYDHFTTDITENRVLAGATRRLLRVAGLNSALTGRLRRLNLLLNDIEPTFDPGTAMGIVWSRLNDRYRIPVGLAVLGINATTIEEHSTRSARASSFLVDMNRIFEAEVTAGLQAACRHAVHHLIAQGSMWLDGDRNLSIRPDITVRVGTDLAAVADVKYKQPDLRGIDSADVYQVLAYAHRFRLRDVHLVYPTQPTITRLTVGDITVHLHHVDITADPQIQQAVFSGLLAALVGVLSPATFS